MISYNVIRSAHKAILEVEIKGHADYDKSGKDIVCSAVSTLIISTLNAIERFEEKEHILEELDEGYAKIKVLKHTKIIDGLLENLVYSLDDISQQFPKYLKEV